MIDAATTDREKRAMLFRLTEALDALSRRMTQQRDNARAVTLLVDRAERLAEAAWNLDRLQGAAADAAAAAFAADVTALADAVGDAASRAGQEMLLGRQVAQAITQHADELAVLLRSFDTIPNMDSLRAALRPLVVTLASVSERMKADRAIQQDVETIASHARDLAEQAGALAANAGMRSKGAIGLSRDLRQFAAETGAFSTRMAEESRLAVEAVEHLATQTRSFGDGQRVWHQTDTATARMVRLAREGPDTGDQTAAPGGRR